MCILIIINVYRFAAVHFPINFNQCMNDPNLLKQRMLKYLFPVCLITLVVNINKFFEQIVIDPIESGKLSLALQYITSVIDLKWSNSFNLYLVLIIFIGSSIMSSSTTDIRIIWLSVWWISRTSASWSYI